MISSLGGPHDDQVDNLVAAATFAMLAGRDSHLKESKICQSMFIPLASVCLATTHGCSPTVYSSQE